MERTRVTTPLRLSNRSSNAHESVLNQTAANYSLLLSVNYPGMSQVETLPCGQ